MRSFICCAVALGCFLPGVQVVAQSDPGSTLAPPPSATASPVSAVSATASPPASTPAATTTPAEAPSEPWKPPTGDPVAEGGAPNVLPEAELPAPNGSDSAAADPATKALMEEQE